MGEKYKIGIIGCGDFLRRQTKTIQARKRVQIKSLFDLEETKTIKYARVFGAQPASSAEEIFTDQEIQIHCAVDPEKTKGPFMDAMIHTLNIVRYLMAGEVTFCCLFSHNYAQNLSCNDTEFLKVDFSGGGPGGIRFQSQRA